MTNFLNNLKHIKNKFNIVLTTLSDKIKQKMHTVFITAHDKYHLSVRIYNKLQKLARMKKNK